MLSQRRVTVPYATFVVDASAALVRALIVARDVPIVGVEVRQLTAAAAPVLLHFGPRADGVRVREGSTIVVPGDALGTGLYLSCAAGGAGATVELVVLYDDAAHQGAAFRVRDP